MIYWIFLYESTKLTDVRRRYFPGAKLERSPTSAAGEHDRRVQNPRRGLVAEHLAARRFLQKRQTGYLSRDECAQSLPVALPRQNAHLHGQVS